MRAKALMATRIAENPTETIAELDPVSSGPALGASEESSAGISMGISTGASVGIIIGMPMGMSIGGGMGTQLQSEAAFWMNEQVLPLSGICPQSPAKDHTWQEREVVATVTLVASSSEICPSGQIKQGANSPLARFSFNSHSAG